jgi:lysophospholipase L1-like esterase
MQVRTDIKNEEAFFNIIDSESFCGSRRPEHFKKIMRENRGAINKFSPFGMTDDGLERKNPLIVALGDSVTAGHFEFAGNPSELFAKVDNGELKEDEAIEITDARECYLEKFRGLLIDKYEQTSVSTVNSGIAGDTMLGMERRLYRDVVRYQPDLIIINGSLNWASECGSTEVYEKAVRRVLSILKKETKADIVLLTPNMERNAEEFANPESSLESRVEVLRKLADETEVCIADTYKAWEKYEAEGYPVEDLLANRMNHPTMTGHLGYDKILMQLIK